MAEPSQARTRKSDRNAPWWIKAFVVFHIIAITIWALPNPPENYSNGQLKLGIDSNAPGGVVGSFARTLTDGLLVWKVNYGRPSFFKYYTLSTGFWQYWDMFAPNPINYDLYCSADLTYSDGSTSQFNYPRMFNMDVLSKYMAERYRKFFERVAVAPYSWPAFSNRIALLAQKPGNQVAKVTLWMHRQIIPPPDQPLPTEYQNFDFFRAERDGDRWRYYRHYSDRWQEVQDR